MTITTQPDTTTTTRVRASDPLWHEVLDFYFTEAELLDNNEFDEWLTLLADDLSYTMPVRVTKRRADGPGFDDTMAHMDETRESLALRIKRLLTTTTAWAEDPPSRTRRFVTNLRCAQQSSGLTEAKTNLLLLRNRWDDPQFELFCAERRDVLRPVDDSFQLVSRQILVDQTRLGNINLALFY
jgi:3-phenylpropionate/cinnamic acid dioxygenase small subunit